MSLPIYSFSEPITEPDILESIRALPTEDDLPCDDAEPMETPRHRDRDDSTDRIPKAPLGRPSGLLCWRQHVLAT